MLLGHCRFRVCGRGPILATCQLVAALSLGCARLSTSPAPALTHVPRSSVDPLAKALIEAFRTSELAAVYASLTPELRGRLRLGKLEAASARIRKDFGKPQGIIEQSQQREGPLTWHSLLVEYHRRRVDGSVQAAPLLYQFAVDPHRQISRLVVREHVFLSNIKGHADDYIPITRIHFPSNAKWFVLHGGRKKKTNYHHGHRAQRFAYDLVVKRHGRLRRRHTAKSNNAAHYCHGQDILAPAAGIIVRAINNVPENRPGSRGGAGGNGVVIDHGFGEYSNIWHAIPGSVRVQVGDRVEAGQPIAKVGNSGRSTLPHIHFHVSYRTGPNGEKERFGLPAEFVDVFVDDRWKQSAMPKRGEYIQPIEIRAPRKR